MKQIAHPFLSCSGQKTLTSYEHWLCEREDLTQASIRNYLSDLRHFIAWFEAEREVNAHDDSTFTPHTITTPLLTRYRSRLQTIQRQKPASVNRSLISLKRYAAKLSDISPHDLRHRFGYCMAEAVPLHRLAQIMGHDSLDTTKLYIQGTRHDLQQPLKLLHRRKYGSNRDREGNTQLMSKLGCGGFAEVSLGEHIHLRTQAAVSEGKKGAFAGSSNFFPEGA